MPLDAFDPAMLRSLERSGQVERIVANLRSVTGVVEDLGLNTRIWSKVAQAA